MGRLDNYEEVKDRLKRVHAASNDIRFTTQVLNHNEDYSRVVIKAFMYEGEALIATGIAMDWQNKDRNANRTNWVEVAETSAIGRAIANSKFQDPNAPRASLDEMQVANERVEALDAPVTKESSGLVDLSTPNVTPAQQKPAWVTQVELRFGSNEYKLNNFFIKGGQIKQGQTFRDLSENNQKILVDGLDALCQSLKI